MLTDAQWARIEPLLPDRTPPPRDLPAEFGSWKGASNRLRKPGEGGNAVCGGVAAQEVGVAGAVMGEAAAAGGLQVAEGSCAGKEVEQSAVGGIVGGFEEEDQGVGVVVGVGAVGVARAVQDGRYPSVVRRSALVGSRTMASGSRTGARQLPVGCELVLRESPRSDAFPPPGLG